MPAEKATIAGAQSSPIAFDRIAAFPPPGWQIPRQVATSPDGRLITYLQSESGSDEMVLWAFDLTTRQPRVLLRAAELSDPSRPVSREQELRRERQRQRIKGVTSYAWAREAPVLLVPLGDMVFVRTADGAIRQLDEGAGPVIDPQLCADGTQVAFARGRELFVTKIDSAEEEPLTSAAPATVTRGQSDFIMQEELGEPSGLWWSPRCDRLAYLEVDAGAVTEIPIMGYRGRADLEHHRYPRAGERNTTVRLGVVDLASRQTVWVRMPASEHFDPDDQYLGRMTWSRDGESLLVQRLSRDQHHLALMRVEPRTGEAVELLAHHEPDWAEMTAQIPLASGELLVLWPEGGHRHLRLLDATTGATSARLTSGDWDVDRIVGVDETRGRVLFTANKDEVLGRIPYAVTLGGDLTRLSPENGVHEVFGQRPEHGWVDIHSALDRPPRAVVRGPDGAVVGELEVPREADFDALQLRAAELVEVPVEQGPTLYGALLTPRRIQAGVRYPAIVMVYGGPGVQTVLDEFNPRLLWQHLADRGFVVFQLDNRGSRGRGHGFESPLYLRLGELELADQLRGLDYLCALPFVDRDRVGIYGHSYGGYLAALAMLRAPGRFKVGVAGSPVVDWKLYDTGYTERYLGTPARNPEAYERAALTPLARQLAGKLLVIHALMDENVHFAHSAALIDALVAADKDFDLLVFPGERHGYRSAEARRYASRRVIEYFVANL